MSDLGDSAVTVAPQLETQQSAAEFRAHAEQDSVKADSPATGNYFNSARDNDHLTTRPGLDVDDAVYPIEEPSNKGRQDDQQGEKPGFDVDDSGYEAEGLTSDVGEKADQAKEHTTGSADRNLSTGEVSDLHRIEGGDADEVPERFTGSTTVTPIGHPLHLPNGAEFRSYRVVTSPSGGVSTSSVTHRPLGHLDRNADFKLNPRPRRTDQPRYYNSIMSLQSVNIKLEQAVAKLRSDYQKLFQSKAEYAKELNKALIDSHTELMKNRIELNKDIEKLNIRSEKMGMEKKLVACLAEYLSTGQALWMQKLRDNTAAPDFSSLLEMEKRKEKKILETTMMEKIRTKEIKLATKAQNIRLMEENIEFKKKVTVEQLKVEIEEKLRIEIDSKLKLAQEQAWQEGYDQGKLEGYEVGLEAGQAMSPKPSRSDENEDPEPPVHHVVGDLIDL